MKASAKIRDAKSNKVPNTKSLIRTLPSQFIANVNKNFKTEGAQWLRALPDTLNALIREWDLTQIIPFENLSYNFVSTVYCGRHSRRLVLKCGVPNRDFSNEIAALDYLHGSGAPKVLESIPSLGAFLMEQVSPGNSLKSSHAFDDEGAVTVAADVIKRLHSIKKNVSQKNNFPNIREWHSSLITAKPCKNLCYELLNNARNRLEYLIDSQQSEVLLHADLHHDNILSSETQGFVAIDPKGVFGDPAFEIGTFMRNPFPELMAQENLPQILFKRLLNFSSLLNIDKQRLLDASIAQIVLSACWYREENSEELMKIDIRCAEQLLRLRF